LVPDYEWIREASTPSAAHAGQVTLPTVSEPATVACVQCRRELAADSPELRIELTDDDEPLYYCAECWQQEFGDEPA
jgi:hypothetical protein